MKKILFTLLLVLGISAAADAQVRFLDSSTDAVRKEAIAQDKLVFIDLYATWCGPCKAMERDVFSKKEVGDFMDEYFVAAKYDIDKPTGKALAGKHGVRSIPTYLVFNTEGDLLGKITGSMPAEEFTAALRKIIAETGEKSRPADVIKNGNDSCMRIVSVLLFRRALNTT